MAGLCSDWEIRAALERISSSPSFAKARRAQDFLRFVTEETLAGRERAISGYCIAVAVFGKPPDFDAANDPLVRGEATRLRSRLCEYYNTVGAGDAVRIELARGTYVPTFRRVLMPVPAMPAPRRRPAARSLWLLAPSAAGLVAIAWAVGGVEPLSSALGVLGAGRPMAAIAESQTEPRIRVEPFAPVEETETAYLAFGITEEVVTRLGAYRDLEILVARGADVATLAARHGAVTADFVLSGSVSTAHETIRVRPQLIDAHTGRPVWTADYEEPLAANGVWEVVESVAEAVAAAVGEPYGPLFGAEVSRAALTARSDPYHCLLRFVFALQVISEKAHGRATACFEQAVSTDPSSSMSWARLAALYRMEYLHGFNAKLEAPPPLERAEDAARRALELDESNAFAHEETAFLHLLRGDREAFEDSVARTLALQPSADIRAALGINFIKMGEVERGLALIDGGIADSPRAPPFFFLGYVVQALRIEDYDAAYAAAERMATRDWPLSQAMLAAVAALVGEPAIAKQAVDRLLELQPAFAANGRELIARGRLGEDVESEVIRGLALAGLALD